MMKKKSFIILSQLREEGNFPEQLSLQLVAPQKPASQSELFSRKPQISSIPGISPRERNRYRVTLGDEVIGDRLDLDEALKVTKFGLRPSRGER
jgi:hypothetical protein